MATRSDYDLLGGEFAVYPGHPLTIALCVVRTFKTLAEATEVDPESPSRFLRALTDGAIPGAGGCVHLGLDVLRRLESGESWETVEAWADRAWAECDDQAKGGGSVENKARYIERWKKGQAQADVFKSALRAESAVWFQK